MLILKPTVPLERHVDLFYVYPWKTKTMLEEYCLTNLFKNIDFSSQETNPHLN